MTSVSVGVGVVRRMRRLSPLTWGLLAQAIVVILLAAAGGVAHAESATGSGDIVYSVNGGSGQWTLWAESPDDTNNRRLTPSGVTWNSFDPAVSPDGTKIAFASDQGGDFGIYVMNSDGSGVTLVANNTGDDRHPEWSPDGTKLTYENYSSGDVYVVNADGTGNTDIYDGLANAGSSIYRWPVLTPDGSKVVFEEYSGYKAVSVSPYIHTYPVEYFYVSRPYTGGTCSGSDPDINYYPPGGASTICASEFALFSINPDGTGLARLSAANGIVNGTTDSSAYSATITAIDSPRYSPGGATIAMLASGISNSNLSLYYVNASSGVASIQTVAHSILPSSEVAYSIDGTSLIYSCWTSLDSSCAGQKVRVRAVDGSSDVGLSNPTEDNDWGYLPNPVTSPADTSTVSAGQVTLEGSYTPLAAAYHFQITTSSDTSFSSPVVDSGWLPTTSTFLPPEGSLTSGQSYLWRYQSKNMAGNASAWSAGKQFTWSQPRLGVRDYWPIWSHGPLSVNEANGNLVLSLPAPSFPTAVGSLGASFTYNSQDSSNAFGLGTGWTMSVGDQSASPPAELIDRSVFVGTAHLASVERVSADGSIDEYGRVGVSSTYLPVAGDGSQLTKNKDGSWTLVDPDGSVFSFGQADATTGVAQLTQAQVLATASGKAKYVYTYTSGKPTSVAVQDDLGNTFSSLSLNWSCTGALVCVTGPDGQTWKYFGESGSTGRLAKVNDGTRDLIQMIYNGSGLPVTIKNANDLDPTNANISPGYLTTHTLSVGYDTATPARVTSVSENNFRDRRYGTVNTLSATWSFAYQLPCSSSLHTAAQSHSTSLPSAVGCTLLTPPLQQGQPQPKTQTTFVDSNAHPIEVDDVLGNYTLSAYNARDQLLWTEDQEGNATDYSYDPVDYTLQSVTGPDPDGAGSLPRPVTSYRYDETQIGSASTPGAALQGLKAAYFDNVNLAGRPKVLQTDPNIDNAWGTSAPPPLPGVTSNYSVRWTGELSVATTGDYTFTSTADNGTRLTIRDADGSGKANLMAINNWKDGPLASVSSQPIHLTAGRHAFTFEFYEKTPTSSSQVRLKWACSGCGISQQVIPQSSLLPAWLNQSSVLTPGATSSPSTRIAFSHYASPDSGNPDYSLIQLGGQNLITSYSYDQFGRLTAKIMPKGNATRSIDSSGNLTGTPTSGFQTSWAYYAAGASATPSACTGAVSANQAGLLQSLTRDGMTAITTVYDTAGRPRSITNAKGTICKAYDNEGRVTSEQAPGDTQATTYTYDPVGAQRTAIDASGTLTSEYNEVGDPIRSVDSFAAETAPVYDKEANIVSQDAGVGSVQSGTKYTTTYVYDAADRMSSLTDPAGSQYSFFYDKRGNLRATQYPNSTFMWNGVNAAGWITEQYNRHGSLGGTLPSTPPADSNPIADTSYVYYPNGQRQNETRTAGGLTTETTSYQYDELGRLTQTTLPDATNRSYAYDLDSNRTSITENGSTVASYTYNPAVTPGVDQLTSVIKGSTTNYTYTGDGQVATRGSDTLTWDGWSRLAGGTFSGNTLTYSFDAAGFRRQRVSQGVTTRYLSGGLFETDTAGTIQRYSVSGPGGDIAQYYGAPATTTQVTFIYNNGHGDSTAQADTSGTRTQSDTYDPFGYLRSSTDLSEYRAFTSTNTDSGCTGCTINLQSNGDWQASIAGQVDTKDTAEGSKDFGGTNGWAGRVYVRTTLRLPAGQTLSNKLYILQVKDKAGSVVYELFLDSSRTLWLSSPAKGLRNTAISQSTSVVMPNDGTTTTRIEVSAQANSSVIVRVNGVDKITLTGLSGATTGNQRYLVAGIDRYDGNSSSSPVTSYHSNLWATQQGWPGDGNTNINQALERYTGRWDKKLDTNSGLVEMGARPYDPSLGRFYAPDPMEGGSLNAYDYADQDPLNEYDLDGTLTAPCPHHARSYDCAHGSPVVAAVVLVGTPFALVVPGAVGYLSLRATVSVTSRTIGASGSVAGAKLLRDASALYRQMPQGLSVRERLIGTAVLLAKPAAVRAARIGAVAATVWRSARRYGR
jgi:RHS repeat-associated protein